MVERAIRIALHHPWLVLFATLAVLVAGIYSFVNQKIDAYPDISGQMVQILTSYPGRAPEEVEQQVTIPIEFAMGNVPRVQTIRSRSIFGLSVVQLRFAEGVEGYWARQRLLVRLPGLNLHTVSTSEHGRLSTVIGEVYRYEVSVEPGHEHEFNLME